MTITVNNNLDGTYTVKCGRESIIVGMPRAGATKIDVLPNDFPPISASGGGAVAHIIDVRGPRRGKELNFDQMLEDMRQEAAERSRAHGRPGLKVLEYTLKGQHTLDVGKIHLALGGAAEQSAVEARIFVGGSRD